MISQYSSKDALQFVYTLLLRLVEFNIQFLCLQFYDSCIQFLSLTTRVVNVNILLSLD